LRSGAVGDPVQPDRFPDGLETDPTFGRLARGRTAMFKTFMIVVVIVIGFPLGAVAEPIAQDAIRTKDNDMVQGFIVGIGRGFEWANADLFR